MRDDKYRATGRKVHKMTRDGLVEQDLATGEKNRVSQRGQEFDLRHDEPGGPDMSYRESRAGHARRSPQTATPERAKSPPFDYRQEAQPDGSRKYNTHGHSRLMRDAEPAISAPVTENGRNNTPNDTFTDNGAGPYENTSGPAETPYRAKIPPNPSQNDTVEPAIDRPGRLRFSREPQAPAETRPEQHGTKYQQKFIPKTTEPEAPAATDAPEPQSSGNSRLQFAKDELPPDNGPDKSDKKLSKLQGKAEKADLKLEKAREKLPSKRRARLERTFDEDTGKTKHRLSFEKEVQSQSAHVKGPLPLRPVKAGANAGIGYAHKKIYQVEHENVGTQAAHKAEVMAEGAARSAYRLHKTAPYRTAAKLEKKAVNANIRYSYQKALRDNPKLQSNPVSRFMQKQRIKRQYAKAAREAKRTGQAIQKTGSFTARIIKAAAGIIRRHPMLVGSVALILLIVFFMSSMLASCANMVTGGFSSIIAASYTAEDGEINSAENSYIEWETDLRLLIDNAETDHPGYDEYRYNLDGIGHGPLELMAYLSARYKDFTYADVESDLREIFDEQYRLEFVEEIEVRYRTEYYTDDDGHEHSYQVPYNWYILNVNLTAQPFTDVIMPRTDADEWEMYGVYMDSKGNRQYVFSPFDFDWLPYVTSNFGWRVHPITGVKDYHTGIDMGVASGTPIRAAKDGTVTTSGYNGDYGYLIAVSHGDGLVTKYAHCDALLASVGQEVKAGDVIAKVGSTGASTGPHLHFEVILNSEYLNPIYFAETK